MKHRKAAWMPVIAALVASAPLTVSGCGSGSGGDTADTHTHAVCPEFCDVALACDVPAACDVDAAAFKQQCVDACDELITDDAYEARVGCFADQTKGWCEGNGGEYRLIAHVGHDTRLSNCESGSDGWFLAPFIDDMLTRMKSVKCADGSAVYE